MSRYSNVIAMLTEAKRLVAIILTEPDDEAFRIRLETNIQRDIDFMSLVTGTGDLKPAEKVVLAPATTIGGQPIKQPRKFHKQDLEPDEKKVVDLREKIEDLYPRFLTIDTKDLLTNYDHLVIRGIAKKAKMKVTKEDPAELTLAFIEQVKDEIRYLSEKDKAADSDNMENIGSRIEEYNKGYSIPDGVDDPKNDEQSETRPLISTDNTAENQPIETVVDENSKTVFESLPPAEQQPDKLKTSTPKKPKHSR